MDAANAMQTVAEKRAAHRQPESADLNFALLATLAACVAFWILVALTVYWLI